MLANHTGRLPVELLREIFVQCIIKKGLVNPLVAPLLLCHVCSAWRAVALEIPAFWDTLTVLLPYKTSQKTCIPAAHITQFWLDNCGPSSPFSFSLRYQDFGTLFSESSHDLSFLDSIIASNANRFCSLELGIQSTSSLSQFFSLPGGRLALLEQLSLSLDNVNSMFTLFCNAPRLRKLSLVLRDSKHEYVESPPSLFPWSQLSHLTVQGRFAHVVWTTFFHQCRVLEYCSLTFSALGFSNNAQVANSTDAVSFPNLITLKLSRIKETLFSPYQFIFPALKTLEIEESREVEGVFWSRLTSPHHGFSLINLHRLCFRHNKISMTTLLDILRATTSLVDLDLAVDVRGDPVSGRDFWRNLTFNAGANPSDQLLTNLEILSLWVYAWPFSSLSLIQGLPKMIESRLFHGPHTPIQHVSLEIKGVDRESADGLKTRLESLRFKGLDIKFVDVSLPFSFEDEAA